PLAKAFIAAVVVAVVGYTGWHYYSQKPAFPERPGGRPDDKSGESGGRPDDKSGEPGKSPAAAKRDPKHIIIGVNDFGGAYPGVVANDGAKAGPKSRFAAAGLDVEIKLIRGSKERLAAFDNGEVDVMLLTLD